MPPSAGLVFATCAERRNVEVGHSTAMRNRRTGNLLWTCKLQCPLCEHAPARGNRQAHATVHPRARRGESRSVVTAVMSMRGESDAMSVRMRFLDPCDSPASRSEFAQEIGSAARRYGPSGVRLAFRLTLTGERTSEHPPVRRGRSRGALQRSVVKLAERYQLRLGEIDFDERQRTIVENECVGAIPRRC